MYVALVNTNRIQPPIAPIGLEYVAEALNAAGHDVELLDLCWADDVDIAIADFFGGTRFDLIGVTLRNTDDSAFTSRESFIGPLAAMVNAIRKHTDGLIVLGGVGFSIMPDLVLELCEADIGVWGDGEFTFPELATRIEEKRDWLDLPNLVWRRDGKWHRNPPAMRPLADLPPMSRSWLDNGRYFREGGQAGFETKRGCPGRCIYCADPLAKGRKVRTRPPKAIVDELETLLAQGIDHLHTCGCEFNLPERHVREICEEIVRRDLGDKLRWYAYCSPVPFSPQLAGLMRRAGCVGINFGADNGDEEMLRRLRRDFAPDDIVAAARSCQEADVAVMFDLLLGAPGETRESLVRSVELMRQAEPDRVGVSLGVRVYPGTPLATLVTREELKEGLVSKDDPAEPLFFIEPRIAPFAFGLLDDLVGDDKRFLFFDPSKPDINFNYNANQLLVDAIQEGYRGAYWDILRRYE
jgi:tryptophan 2-C-methyltransferase